MKTLPLPALGNHLNAKEQARYLVTSLCGFIEDAVALLTLGFVVWELRAWSLFQLFED